MNKKILILVGFLFWFLTSCNVMFNLADLDLIVKQGQIKIEHNKGAFSFGNIAVNSPSDAIEFTIENLSSDVIYLTDIPIVQLAGNNPDDFIADSSYTSHVILPNKSTHFTITFSPLSEGAKSATVLIANDTNYRNPYKFTITGFADPHLVQPIMNIKQGENNIPNSTGSFDFGNISINSSSVEISFTIQNLGTEDLFLTGMPIINKQGPDSEMFVINDAAVISLLSPGFETIFTIKFSPTSIGNKTADIIIENNDPNNNPYIFTVLGNAIPHTDAPIINIKQGANNIPNGVGSYNFGNVTIGMSSPAVVFTIENLGNLTLNLTGSPNKIAKSGGQPALFIINESATNATIQPGYSTTFTITFRPTTPNNKSTTIRISNSDNERNPYTFTVLGNCIIPEINIKQGSTNIPSITGIFDFGFVNLGSSNNEVVFTIENLGPGQLLLTGTPKISVSGTDAVMFIVNESATVSPVAPSSFTTFSVTFNPSEMGYKTATISIPNNDTDENPYRFTLTATTILPCSALGWIGGGSGGWKTTNGASASSSYEGLRFPSGVFVDSAGYIYVADMSNHRITKWNSSGNALGWIGGGSNGWKSLSAPAYGNDYQSFYNPRGVLVDNLGYIYVSDTSNHRISKWDSAGNAIGWFGGGSNGWKTTNGTFFGSDYQSLNNPAHFAMDSAGNFYIADYNNHRISKWTSSAVAVGWIGGGISGWKTTNGANAGTDYQSFRNPAGIFVDGNGVIYVSEYTNHRISRWSSAGNGMGWIGGGSNGWKTGVAPSHSNTYQSFRNPSGIWLDTDNNIYVADYNNHRVSKWDSSGDAIGWIGGATDGWKVATAPSSSNNFRSFNRPRGIFVDSLGYIYIADTYNHRVSKWED